VRARKALEPARRSIAESDLVYFDLIDLSVGGARERAGHETARPLVESELVPVTHLMVGAVQRVE